MNQKAVDKIIEKLLDQLIPAGTNITKMSKAAGLGETTLRVIKSRKSISADTLIKLLIAQGVSPDALINLPRSKPSKISKTLTEWNRLGLAMSEKERDRIGRFIKNLRSDWKLK